MRAVVTYEHGGLDRLVYEPDYRDPVAGPGDVILRVHACTLNYHDVFTRRGMPGIKVPLPLVLGIDVAGEVAALGPGVSGFSVGDRVLVDPIERVNGGLLGESFDGGLAELVRVPAHMLIALPDDVGFAEAAALPVAYGTAYRMMLTRGKIQAGETVLVLGASGGVGTCCVQLAKQAGATVIACASSDEKLARLEALGADVTINYATTDWVAECRNRFGRARVSHRNEGGIDVVVNFTGGETWVPSLKVMRRDGRLLTCGATAGYDPAEDLRLIWTFELNIVGSNGWSRDDILALLTLVREKKLEPVLHPERFPLERAVDAMRLLDDRGVYGKVVVEPG
ncbi:MAG: SDR family NAD(P)-dependent oxidoreductase [Rhizobiales bacterium]|nr:SDR family NAD(P)-dependent oxidoreductase [Hyphomicrobiales bacterium]MBN9009056.1 SDR family NAD(P)-dependent oxidoreductase [Hyphomicrobiales bacterium]